MIDTNVSGLRVQQYRTSPIPLSQQIPPVPFADKVRLQGYEVILPQPTGEIYVLLKWDMLQELDAHAKTFVHLVNDTTLLNGSPLWKQDDLFPVPTMTDSTMTLVYRLDQMTLLPQGDYQVLCGWYDARAWNALAHFRY
ncbi:MAG UNVERIFIED_CONTAM: hypothetical protein LVT10_08980 [Anaerolineae bacterium]